MGIGYIVDCIYNAIAERVAEENYRAYETDCLMAICRTLGVKIPKRYYEILHPAPEDEPILRSAREALENIIIEDRK